MFHGKTVKLPWKVLSWQSPSGGDFLRLRGRLYMEGRDNDSWYKGHFRPQRICAHCGKEIGSGDLIKGFKYDKDQYVMVSDQKIEKVKAEKEKFIQILHFMQFGQISSVYYDQAYRAISEPDGEKAPGLLKRAHGRIRDFRR